MLRRVGEEGEERRGRSGPGRRRCGRPARRGKARGRLLGAGAQGWMASASATSRSGRGRSRRRRLGVGVCLAVRRVGEGVSSVRVRGERR